MINGFKVETVKVDKIEYIQFFDAIRNFENGQVYSVWTKDKGGNFVEINKEPGLSFLDRPRKVSEYDLYSQDDNK